MNRAAAAIACAISAAALHAATDDLLVARRALADGLWQVAAAHAAKAETNLAERAEARAVQLEAWAGAGRTGEMQRLLDRWDQRDRDDHRYWRAWIAVKENRLDSARRALLAEFADPALAALAARLAARLETRAGNRAAAIAAFAKADALLAQDPAARAANALEAAEFFGAAGETPKALDLLEQSGALAAAGETGARAQLLAGRLHLAAQDPAAATAAFEAAIARTDGATATTRAAAAAEAARLKHAQGDLAAAIALAERGASIAGPGATAPALELGFLLINDSARRDEGIALIRRTVRANPGAPEIRPTHLKFADALLQLNRAEEAEAEYSILLQTYPEYAMDAHIAEGRGWAAAKSGRFAESAGIFARAAQLATNAAQKAQCTVKQGDSLAAAGRHAEAAEIYAKAEAIAQAPAQIRQFAQFQRADALARAGSPRQALDIFTRILDARGEQAVPAALRAAALESAAGRLEQAIALYGRLLGGTDESLNLVDENPAEEEKRLKELDEQRRRAAKLPPLTPAQRAEALSGRGKAFYGAYRFTEAGRDFAAVAAEFPDRADEMAFLSALCLYGAGQDEAAAAAARKLLAAAKDAALKAEVLLWTAKYDYGRREYAAARDAFLAYAAEAAAPRLRRNRALVRAARCAAALGDHPAAAECAAKAAAAALNAPNPSTAEKTLAAEALAVQGEALLETARFDEAALALDRVRTLAAPPELALRAAVLKADCLFAMGADDDARYRQALEAYRAVLANETISPSMKLAISFKTARTLEKLRRHEEAADVYYTNVVMAYCDGVQDRCWFDGEARAFFARAVFILADYYEMAGENLQAIRVLGHLAGSDVQSAGEAARRIARLKKKGGAK